MKQNTGITTIILHKNAEEHLEKALASVQWCDERIIIDDNSTKNIENLAKKYDAVVIKRPLTRFDEQRNFGLQQTHTPWIMFLDADEIVSLQLAEEIKHITRNTKRSAFFVQRHDIFLGKTLRFGETGNIKFIRLARKDAGLWKRPVHETWDVHGQTGILEHVLLHTPHESISSFIEKINHYTDLEVQYRKEQGEKFSLINLFLYPHAKFFVNYICKLGFLDGFSGFVMAWMMSLHSLVVRVKMYETK